MKETEAAGFPLVAVAMDGGKSSMKALKWAVKNFIRPGQTIILVHVNTNLSASSSSPSPSSRIQDGSGPRFIVPSEPEMKELFLPFGAFCTRKDVQCMDILLEDTDIAMAIAEFVSYAAIKTLVVGAPYLSGFVRLKANDISGCITKAVPDFCTVYVIANRKISSMKSAIRPAPTISPLRSQIQMSQGSINQEISIHQHRLTTLVQSGEVPTVRNQMSSMQDDISTLKNQMSSMQEMMQIVILQTATSRQVPPTPSTQATPVPSRPATPAPPRPATPAPPS